MILLLVLVSGFFLVFYFKEYLNRRKSPPGPWPLPVLGNLIQMALASPVPNLAIAKFSEKYGNIFKLKVGFTDMVVLSSLEAVKDVLSKEEALGRLALGTQSDRNKGKDNLGIALAEGPIWEQILGWTVKNLREFGFNKTGAMERATMEEISTMLDKIEKTCCSEDGRGIIEVGGIFSLPIYSIMWKMSVGHCTEEDLIVMDRLLKKSSAMLSKGIFGAGISTAFPFMRFIFPEYLGQNVQMDFYQEVWKVGNGLLQEAKLKIQNDKTKTPQNLIEAYALKMIEDGENSNFTEDCFEVLFIDLLQGSSDTTSSYLEGLILYMILYPDVQAKVYREIEEVVPKGQPIDYEDKKSMIYIQAVMLEAHRCIKVLQNLVPRKAMKDFYYNKYLIKQGTMIMADMHSIYTDSKTWEDSFDFKPERFLDSTGHQLMNQKSIIAFGVGKRNCPGIQMAELTTFLFFTELVRKYHLSLVPGDKLPSKEMQVGYTSRPVPFRAYISPREA